MIPTHGTRKLALVLLISTAHTCIALADNKPAQNAPKKEASAPSLYQRLGSFDGVARFVDTAFPRVAAHPELNHLFRGHSTDSQYRQRQLIVDTLCKATGGPCVYVGREMRTVHVGLNITDANWTTFLGILSTAMDDLKIQGPNKRDFLAVIASFRPAVVEKP
jgi:hemoglobin